MRCAGGVEGLEGFCVEGRRWGGWMVGLDCGVSYLRAIGAGRTRHEYRWPALLGKDGFRGQLSFFSLRFSSAFVLDGRWEQDSLCFHMMVRVADVGKLGVRAGFAGGHV